VGVMDTTFSRRAVVGGCIAASTASLGARAGLGVGSEPIPLADMHMHLFFIGPHPASEYPLGPAMTQGRSNLAAWSLVGDLMWLRSTNDGLKQKSKPRQGEAGAFFRAELQRMKKHAFENGLKIVTTPEHIAKARCGERHIVLAVEGAFFLDEDPGLLKIAHDEGVRHLQLVHYTRNTLGDFQTARPLLNGLTEAGRMIIAECNRLGILVDMAHSTPEAVRHALAVSKKPLIWSHGSVVRGEHPSWRQPAWQARRLDLETAQAITKTGGVLGLWGLRSDIGEGVENYTDRLVQLIGWLGENHVGFGSDMNSSPNPAVGTFRDLRRVVDTMQRRKIARATIEKVAFDNYARILTGAMIAGNLE
jgi:membrane dipeptidase